MTRHSAILTNLLLSLPLAAGLLCAAPNASAQTTASVTIPFAFSANHQQVAAGSYQVQLLSDRFLSLRDTKTAKTQIVMVRPEPGRVIEAQGRLVFHRYGSRNYLMQVWLAGTNKHSELVVRPTLEQKLTKNIPAAGSSFEVALK